MTDSKEELICPACHKKMAKIEVDGINIDICINGCGSFWFDNRETEKFAESDNSIKIEKALKKHSFEKIYDNHERFCPVCNVKMVQHKASEKCDVIIDDCYNCGGKFLDYGELEKIRNIQNSTEEKIKTITEALYRKNGYTSYKKDENSVKNFLGTIYKNHMK